MKTKAWLILVIWLAICQLPSILGVQFVYTNMVWYNTLLHPHWTPPGVVFGMVWAALYVLLGISAFLAFREKLYRNAMMLFVGQLALNACWTPLFFGAHSLTGGLILIVAMLAEFIFLLRAFGKINTASAWLLVPYGVWLLFATYLTAATWWLN